MPLRCTVRFLLLAGAVLSGATAAAVAVVVEGGSSHPQRPITSFSFGGQSTLYDRGNLLVTSTPQLGPRGSTPVTVLDVKLVYSGCPAKFGKPELELATPGDPYNQGFAIPPADKNQPLTGVKHRGDLVLRRRGIDYAAWYFVWQFSVPSFCRLTVTGYDIRYRTPQGMGSEYIAQQNVYVYRLGKIYGDVGRSMGASLLIVTE